MRTIFVLTIAAMVSFASVNARAACGDKITVDGVAIIVPPVVTWDANVAEAIQVAKIKKKPFAIYFVSKENSKIVGESLDAIKEYMKANNNTVPNCLSDVPVAIDQARSMGVGNFVKVPLRKDNHDLVEKYGGADNTMVICDLSGEKLSGFACTTEGMKNLDPVRQDITAWQARNPRPAMPAK